MGGRDGVARREANTTMYLESAIGAAYELPSFAMEVTA
jgi:hypothetical protein